MDVNLCEVTSSAVLEEKKKLRKEFRYLDMIFYIMGHNDTRNQDVVVEMSTREANVEKATCLAGE